MIVLLVQTELSDGLHCLLCRLGLLCCDCPDGGKHGGIDCTSVVQEGSKNFLYVFSIRGVKCWGIFWIVCVLHFGARCVYAENVVVVLVLDVRSGSVPVQYILA